jgi:hypothetical protein
VPPGARHARKQAYGVTFNDLRTCANGMNDANYGFNNVNLYQFMWYHKIPDRLWFATEDYYEYQKNVPTVSTIPGANPALCSTGTQCWAGAYALSGYLMYQVTDKDYIGLRSEAFDDVRGQRTGFASWYAETTLGWVHHPRSRFALKFGTTIHIRRRPTTMARRARSLPSRLTYLSSSETVRTANCVGGDYSQIDKTCTTCFSRQGALAFRRRSSPTEARSNSCAGSIS